MDTSENQHLTKQERKELRRQEERQQQDQIKKRKTRRKFLIWAVIILVVGGGMFGIIKLSSQPSHSQDGQNANIKSKFDIAKKCVTHGRLGMHIHPFLSIVINGDEEDIPANIGIASSTCFRPIHTHDSSGKLHIEWLTERNFTLGEFFEVWGKTFNKGQILDHIVDDNHTLTVTVNGVTNEKYENLIFKDNDQVIIKYETKK